MLHEMGQAFASDVTADDPSFAKERRCGPLRVGMSPSEIKAFEEQKKAFEEEKVRVCWTLSLAKANCLTRAPEEGTSNRS